MQARIYIPTRSTMQSGRGDEKWVLELVKKLDAKFKENLMGRVSSTDMSNEVKLKFSTLEAAIEFAKRNNYDFEIIKPNLKP